MFDRDPGRSCPGTFTPAERPRRIAYDGVQHRNEVYVRSAEESDELVSRLAERARERQNEPIARQWETQARRYRQDAALVREMLEERTL
jgi:hypothetical protein